MRLLLQNVSMAVNQSTTLKMTKFYAIPVSGKKVIIFNMESCLFHFDRCGAPDGPSKIKVFRCPE